MREGKIGLWVQCALQEPLGERDLGLVWYKTVLVLCVVLILPTTVGANIGKVISAKPGAQVTRAGAAQPLRSGMEVASGDAITTDRNGVVQLVFVDETKIAIGPNSHMVLDVTMLRGNRKAKNFAVQALGGSFRFISGKSRKRAYSVKTPSATMAVRGTTFDMWVASGQQSAMLVLQGTVQMCGLQGSCRSTGRQCSLYATSSGGSVGRPVDQAQYDKALQLGFPFVQSQAGLLPPLQIEIDGCERESAPVFRVKANRAEPVRTRPARAEVRDSVRSSPTARPEPEPPAEVDPPTEEREPEREEPEPEEPERGEPEREETERGEAETENPEQRKRTE